SLGALSDLLGEDEINSNTGRRILKSLLENDFDPKAYVEEHQLAQINDRSVLKPIVQAAIATNKRAVKDYLGGKETALRAVIGFVMKETKGRGNPLLVEEMIREAIVE
ncbi:MAG TPA: Asp-tRNA(Asn)/Glu-tRNA(Gln) amidotransferase GatCAB subunit B, partial [Bacillota bacterium]|nr:Asp-tRNA(Asn)/Glu-tRNA(Gln) amidotransferase GatCAB subunit B [Bacillota bacterium]